MDWKNGKRSEYTWQDFIAYSICCFDYHYCLLAPEHRQRIEEYFDTIFGML